MKNFTEFLNESRMNDDNELSFDNLFDDQLKNENEGLNKDIAYTCWLVGSILAFSSLILWQISAELRSYGYEIDIVGGIKDFMRNRKIKRHEDEIVSFFKIIGKYKDEIKGSETESRLKELFSDARCCCFDNRHPKRSFKENWDFVMNNIKIIMTEADWNRFVSAAKDLKDLFIEENITKEDLKCFQIA